MTHCTAYGKRMVSKTQSSVALIEIEWKCTYLMPCGQQGTYYKPTYGCDLF